jgi:hypothetical protein
MVKHPIKLPMMKASDSSRSRDHDRKIKSEIYALKETQAVKMNQISEKTRSKFLLLVYCLPKDEMSQSLFLNLRLRSKASFFAEKANCRSGQSAFRVSQQLTKSASH